MAEQKKIKVLLVDDERVFAETLSERLRSRDFSARAVFGGKEALDDIAHEEPDVIVLDLKMPEMDGMEVLRRVREKYPRVETIILSGHGTSAARERAVNLGAVDFLEKPVELAGLVRKINEAFIKPSGKGSGTLYPYRDFISILKQQLDKYDISLGENALGTKCFCRDDNQDQIGYLLAGIGRSSGWFDLNSFGAFPAGRSFESFGPPSHHIPDRKEIPWIILVHATHVGCDSNYILGLTDRYGMSEQSPSCGLLAKIISRHRERIERGSVEDLRDFEMDQAERALKPFLDTIIAAEYPMASIADRLLGLGSEVFDRLLRNNMHRVFYLGGINVDYDPEHPEKNFFVPKMSCIFENSQKTDIVFG